MQAKSKSKSGRTFDLPSEQEEAEIKAGIGGDPDTRELTDEEFGQLRPIGRPKAEVMINYGQALA
ncbi:hypothetical protein [Marinobacter halophilus]|uniref:Uncharacterized protein n=1 Tax=Marinobacter halophilus TaxID=1323740 RepID=A0A2T1KE44_9GAMM|nr:hypothetical protein [Marinobacter halophilus]PSF07812.1 hypothetical protein C7H08_10415 [Marinobacter halophilus]GGC57270.1 hypothetical protein GCM10011362_02100 [Marinobacter halophilus]